MIRVEALTLKYNDFVALDDVSLTVEPGEIMAVLGPSGSGKSSLLRAIAGLEAITSGSIWLGENEITSAPIHKRRIGLMFQDYALFPHLDVRGNVGFGLRMAGADSATLEARVAEVLAWVGLEGYGERPVASLSGGEQQRVALARALAPEPAVLMLDEPVGALDRALRARLVPELSSLLRAVGISAIYVTHDQTEALEIADRIALLNKGRVVQVDTPEGLWRRPRSEFVARFLGFDNIGDVRVQNGVATTPWGAMPTVLPDGNHRAVLPPGGALLDPEGDVPGIVTDSVFVGGRSQITVKCLSSHLTIEVHGTGPAVGSTVRIRVSPEALVRLDHT